MNYGFEISDFNSTFFVSLTLYTKFFTMNQLISNFIPKVHLLSLSHYLLSLWNTRTLLTESDWCWLTVSRAEHIFIVVDHVSKIVAFMCPPLKSFRNIPFSFATMEMFLERLEARAFLIAAVNVCASGWR